MNFNNLNEALNMSFEKAEVNSSAFSAQGKSEYNMITLPSEAEQLLPDADRAVLENKRFVKSELEHLIAQCQEVVIQQKECILEQDSRPSAQLTGK